MEQEIFKPIKGYEGYYEVSNLGRVKSLAKVWSVGRKKDTILSLGNRKNGYNFVILCVDKIKKYASVHRLVAEHFCHKKEGCNVVNHLDSNTQNNNASNLEWTTYSGNAIHAFEKGRRKGMIGEKHPNRKISLEDVLKIKQMCSLSNFSQKQIANLFNIRQSQVSRIKTGTRWNNF
jgi:predicted XRE-type DNA-binding protein